MKQMSKLLFTVLAFCLAITMCGCSLAVPGTDETASKDMFIGFFITNDYFAEPMDAEYVADADSECGAMTYVFPVEGIRFFNATIKATENQEGYRYAIIDTELSSVNTAYNDSDITMTGTLYANPEISGYILYRNSVYQRADGSIYMVPGEGIWIGSSPDCNFSANETYTITKNGVKTSATTKAEVLVKQWTHTDSYGVYFMSEKNEVLRSETYTSDDCPQDVTVPDGCEWIFIMGYDGTRTVLRNTLTIEDSATSYVFYFPGDGYFAIGHSVYFNR